MERSRKRALDSADVFVMEPDVREEPCKCFPLLPSEIVAERRQPGSGIWQAETRLSHCRSACFRVSSLVRKELDINSTTLGLVVQWLLAKRSSSTLGNRLPAAVMQSHMGTTVDKTVYHPQLRAALRQECTLSCLVPVSSQDTALASQVLSLVGAALWKAYQACVREKRALRARTERGTEEVSLPWSLHTLPTIAALAEEWRKESGISDPVQIVLLLEEYSAAERSVLRSLFHSLAEVQTQERYASKLAFSVVLWASSETEMEADLFDHLFWTKYPFLPASTMLKNVMFAALVEPTLPFLLPPTVYNWILQHFSNESHSLAWFLHLLHSLIFHFYSSTAGSWALAHTTQSEPANSVPGFHHELRRLLPEAESAAVSEISLQQQWYARLDEWKRFRRDRVEAFAVLWRLLLRWNPPKTRSLLEEYGEYLTLSAVGRFDQYVRALVVADVLQLPPEELQRRFDAVVAELRELVLCPHPPPFLTRAVGELEAKQSHQQQAPATQPAPAPAPAAPVASAASDAYVLKKPKDLLLEPNRNSTNNPNLRRSSSSASVLSRRDSLSSTFSADDRNVALVLKCVECILPELAAPTTARFPMLGFSVLSAESDMPSMLWGNHRRQVLAQLERPGWKCVCCRSSVLLDRKKRAEEDDESTHEDVCLAFSFVPRGGKVDFSEWETHFCKKIGLESSSKDAQTRFHRAVRDLQMMGLASFNSNSAFLSKSDI